ncbi:cupredoxin domain-containing protein [Candidatus Daviesbacteria bacterium]|nr:cupredoxin domain-containing protein [Candidatus Daviesbacteria bacterium]
MSRNTILAAVAVVVVLGLGLYLFSRPPQTQAPSPATQTESSPTASESSEAAQMIDQQNLVTISSSGFSPKEITVKVGTVVTWVNEDSEDHTVNSAVHPTHQVYPPLNNVGTLKPGERKGFMFDKVGTYNYHDHLNPSLTGSVTVE